MTLALESSRSASSSPDDGRRAEAAGGGGGGFAAEAAAAGEQKKLMLLRRERMFEKVVTPSDVGKLNRLVVPKHFAEKHLPPLPGGGTVLCFQDARGGSTWRFRYSYWGSSQSYVMTKGWSRYVRDKRLAAGDTVAFCRDGASRLFIDCRRRSNKRGGSAAAPMVQQQQQHLWAPPRVVVVDGAPALASSVEEEEQETRQRQRFRLFGVDLLELRSEPMLLDLQLAMN